MSKELSVGGASAVRSQAVKCALVVLAIMVGVGLLIGVVGWLVEHRSGIAAAALGLVAGARRFWVGLAHGLAPAGELMPSAIIQMVGIALAGWACCVLCNLSEQAKVAGKTRALLWSAGVLGSLLWLAGWTFMAIVSGPLGDASATQALFRVALSVPWLVVAISLCAIPVLVTSDPDAAILPFIIVVFGLAVWLL